ncbi:MAG: hypothetical protein DBP02_00465 [gamma proteobacterium symbiont of Ctena orbiculata]|nr:MAG: hypothetical protein DBP02_00465 [gamma proteobacterium symbiont of Ctena orbiculata]PUB90573.1 MAG: hypothetical protein DBP01_06885 [gamma proteobacterium symbiont of Ctena orbiculata]
MINKRYLGIIMPNRTLQRLALILAIVMLSVWGTILIVDPHLIAGYFSVEPVNHAFAGMMGGALLGLAFISLAGVTRWMQTPRALGVAMAILVVETAYLMLGSGDMLVTLPTTISLVTAAAVAFFLLV